LPESEVERFRQLCEKVLKNEENSPIGISQNLCVAVERKSSAAVGSRSVTP
jgi:hypothetical protein